MQSKRYGWAERAKSGIFLKLPTSHRPIPIPFPISSIWEIKQENEEIEIKFVISSYKNAEKDSFFDPADKLYQDALQIIIQFLDMRRNKMLETSENDLNSNMTLPTNGILRKRSISDIEYVEDSFDRREKGRKSRKINMNSRDKFKHT